MKKIILVDNHKEHIDLLLDLLNEKYNNFVQNYNKINNVELLTPSNRPLLEGCLYKQQNGRFVFGEQQDQSELSEQEFLSMLNSDCYCLVDLCLTVNEEKLFNDGNITNNEVFTLTGYTLIEKIAQITQASIMTKFFISANVGKYAPILAKPLFKDSKKVDRIATSPKGGNQYLSYLPKALVTDRPDDGFCNMAYYNFFTKNKVDN